MTNRPYRVVVSAAARRALSNTLPEHVAAAVWELLTGDLPRHPQRVGKPLQEPYEGLHAARRGTYRIVYRIVERTRTVEVLSIRHRKDAYRA